MNSPFFFHITLASNTLNLVKPDAKDTTPLRVLDLTPRRDQASKPAELIQITGHQALTLNARRSITILWHNAHMQGVEEGKDYSIEIDDLKPDDHKGYGHCQVVVS